jgi:hypothetical protein
MKTQQRYALQRAILEAQPYETLPPDLQKAVPYTDWQEQYARPLSIAVGGTARNTILFPVAWTHVEVIEVLALV